MKIIKRILMYFSIFLISLFLYSCSNQNEKQIVESEDKIESIDQNSIIQENSTTVVEKDQIEENIIDNNYYINETLGIKFEANYLNEKIKVLDNKIFTDPLWYYISVFKIEDNENIKETILGTIKLKWKDIKNCKVINKWVYWANKNYTKYIIDLVDQDIIYSDEELEEIKIADINDDGWPFNAEWKKRDIYNKRLVDLCSDYADPLWLGTSKSAWAKFIYNNKNKFIFISGTSDLPFYNEKTIEILD